MGLLGMPVWLVTEITLPFLWTKYLPEYLAMKYQDAYHVRLRDSTKKKEERVRRRKEREGTK